MKQGQELSAQMDRLSCESADTTDLSKSLMQALTADRRAELIPTRQVDLDRWVSEQLESRQGNPFVARVPEFSAWKGDGTPIYHYFGVDRVGSLTIDEVSLANSLHRRYIRGDAPLFTSSDQEFLRVAFDPDSIYDDARKAEIFGGTTWGEFNRQVDNVAAGFNRYIPKPEQVV